MANTDIASTLIKFLAQNPQLITQFLNHPYSTTQQATGAPQQLSQTDMSEVVTAAAAMSTGNNVDFSNLPSVAATLLAQNGGSVHALTNTLFGSAQQAQQLQQQQQQQQLFQPQAAQQQTTAAASGINLGTLVNLAGALMSNSAAAQAQAAKPQTGANLIDLSDGFDVKDAIGLASLFLANMPNK
ncbi:MAG: hypothetical protein Q4G41_01680 [Coriobacteriales bacterium]|nr:hypothetical protein [Coriobacteriales bacterium]